ncbi:mRNA-decapping enzyme 1B [Coelomomyces lativittatus]|nr:mRNA-decapping enzyme 1B [Coelomomyces lativittatus]
MFLFARTSPPYYGLFVMNRKSTVNSLLPLTELSSIKINGEYLMYRTENNEINGIWFYESKDRDRFLAQIIKFYQEDQASRTHNVKKSDFLANAQNDLNDLLQKAKSTESPSKKLNNNSISTISPEPKSKSSHKEKQQPAPVQVSKPYTSDLERLFSNVRTSLPPKQVSQAKQTTLPSSSRSSNNSSSASTQPPPSESLPATNISSTFEHSSPSSAAMLPMDYSSLTALNSNLTSILPVSNNSELGFPMMFAPPPSHYMYIPPGALLAAAQPLLAQLPPVLSREQFRDHLTMLLQSDPPFLEAMFQNYYSLAQAAQNSSHYPS